ncbi:hypothetical protein NQ176_g1165 [Zarea fungicola]|uniref:Uncharacterized protein n=1 Tax=Zarea fungicola TaxID=93591 RepID=A0ACC1NV34_9HYPO|nr:hypothetical protein NQ176_g1165 [Lecanicillium fungicola]
MRNYVLILALATKAYAWTYPDCEPDGCYRNLIDPRYTGQAPAFCIDWISGTITDAGAIPTQYHNCPDVAPLSSTELFTSGNTSSIEESSSIDTQSPTQSTTLWTTLTIFTTSTDTITKCHATATNCPGESTVILTSVIPLSTTVCPLTAEFHPPQQFPTDMHPPQSSAQAPQSSEQALQSSARASQSPQISGCPASQERGPNGDCNVTSHSTEAPLHPPQSSGCSDGTMPGINGECTPVALTSTWSPPPLPAVTQLLATTAGTHVSTVPSSSSPSVVTAGTDRFGFDATLIVICVAAALI